MSDPGAPIEIDGAILAEAFPLRCRPEALSAGLDVFRRLARPSCVGRFSVQVDGQVVLIPTRLYFASHRSALPENDKSWRFSRALQSRSSDGFERQRAARDLLRGLQPWDAPFIVALIGEYIVEILEDVSAAMTSDHERTLGFFISHNNAFWETTKRRVTSYWSEYYRYGCRSSYRRDEYVGFKLIDRLEMAASVCSASKVE
jgi:hypothetical protein